MKFNDFGLADPLVCAVAAQGYSAPTPIQQQAIPAVLSGRDVVGIAQTGTGKTAAFALPLLHTLHSSAPQPPQRRRHGRPPSVLVLASTRELALQIRDSFAAYGASANVRVAVIYGGVGQDPQTQALKAGVDVLVATPGRLLDLMQQGLCSLQTLKVLVLDEADRMLDMGFFPDIRRILQKVPKVRQTLMFSATMKPEIRELADSMLSDPISIAIEPRQKTTELVTQSVAVVPQKQKTHALIHLLNTLAPSRTIVFSRTKHGADRIVRQLTKAGFSAAAIHANKSQNKRIRILEQFRSTAPPVLVATDIAARGIDVDAVSHVFNFDMPTEEETYVHRIGRAGRAGTPGNAISLCDPEERRMLRSIEKLIGFSIPSQSLEGCELNSTTSNSNPDDTPDSKDRHRRRKNRSDNAREGHRQSRDQRSNPSSSDTDSNQTGQPRRFNGHEAKRREENLTRQRSRSARPPRNQRRADRPNSPASKPANPRKLSQNSAASEQDFGDGVFHAQKESPRRPSQR